MVAKVELYNHNMVFTIDRQLRVICFREYPLLPTGGHDGYDSEIEFNVAYIPYINEMMRMFYNAQH